MAYKLVYLVRWYDDLEDENSFEDCETFDTEEEALDFIKDMEEEE